MQICTSLQTDNHASIPPLSFYRPDTLPAAQPTAPKHDICCVRMLLVFNISISQGSVATRKWCVGSYNYQFTAESASETVEIG